MGFGSILLMAVGLAMDATAVAAARGLVAPEVRPRHALIVAVFFGGSQALMPLFGWWLGSALGGVVAAWDHWIAFALLGAIGGKMLWDAWSGDEDDVAADPTGDPFAPRLMATLAVATSIDALAVGVTLPLIGAPLGLSLVTIGVTTAALSVVGLYVGRRFGDALGSKPDLLGGVVLVGLGVKILVEHLIAG